jgi:hypothetical protein
MTVVHGARRSIAVAQQVGDDRVAAATVSGRSRLQSARLESEAGESH